MTYYELIRASLLKDAKLHPYPKKECGSDPAQPDKKGLREKEEPETDT